MIYLETTLLLMQTQRKKYLNKGGEETAIWHVSFVLDRTDLTTSYPKLTSFFNLKTFTIFPYTSFPAKLPFDVLNSNTFSD